MKGKKRKLTEKRKKNIIIITVYVRETMKSTVQLVNHFVGFGVT